MTVACLNDSRGFLLADGEKLAVGFPASGHMFLVPSYYPASFSINTDSIEISAYGDSFSRHMAVRESIEIGISGYGPIQTIPLEEGMKLFRNADSMSVNELLAVAYQKMNNRKSS
jgi:hypothetical protein